MISGGTKMIYSSTESKQGTRPVFYSISADESLNLKEKIAKVHGVNSQVMKAVDELDRYVSGPETRESSWYWNFFRRVKSGMWCLYPHANDMGMRTDPKLFSTGQQKISQSVIHQQYLLQ
jgi:hypothetical protein